MRIEVDEDKLRAVCEQLEQVCGFCQVERLPCFEEIGPGGACTGSSELEGFCVERLIDKLKEEN